VLPTGPLWLEKNFTVYIDVFNYFDTVIVASGRAYGDLLARCLIYVRSLLEYVIVIVWMRSVNKMLPSAKFAEDKVLTFLILREKC